MSQTPTIDWQGQSGQTYRYWFLSTPGTASSIIDEAGNYMFVRPSNTGWWPVYIGIADSLRSRIPSHERWAGAARLGATHVMAHGNTTNNRATREAEEKDLIARWNPPLNVQHRTSSTSTFAR